MAVFNPGKAWSLVGFEIQGGKMGTPFWNRGGVRSLFIFSTTFLLIFFDVQTSFSVQIPYAARSHVGLNKFDLALGYQGFISGGSGEDSFRKITVRMAQKSILDAKLMGAAFVRVSVTGYGPVGYNERGDLSPWLENSGLYWSEMDQLMSDLRDAGLKIVPVFLWNSVQFPALSHDTLRNLVLNKDSAARKLLYRYVKEFTDRYKSRDVIQFYELTNEFNLMADLDLVKRCHDETPDERCAPLGNFTSDEMIPFIADFAGFVRAQDPLRLISSGFGNPRESAQHLRKSPEFSAKGADWTTDSFKELTVYLADVHRAVDIVSLHMYGGQAGQNDYVVEGKKGRALLGAFQSVVKSWGKKIYVGEFADVKPSIQENPLAPFSQEILQAVDDFGVEFASPWVFEFYQQSLVASDTFSIEPGFTDSFNQAFLKFGTKLNGAASPIQALDPQIVLTSPIAGQTLADSTRLAAVASAPGVIPVKVEFFIDQKLVGFRDRPPFQLTADTSRLEAGPHRISVRAVRPDGATKIDAVQAIKTR